MILLKLYCIFAVIFNFSVKPNSATEFDNYVFINEFCYEDDFEEDISTCLGPKLVLRCSDGKAFIGNLSVGPKQMIKLGPHRFTHLFYKVNSDIFMTFWKNVYGSLTLTQSKLKFFEFISHANKKYPFYDTDMYKVDYWRSQWNQDQFIIKSSHKLIYENLEENYHQLPTNLQKSVNPPPDISEFAILYTAMSGWGNTCNFKDIHHQLYSLTLNFNSYDMLFCEILTRYNLTYYPNYNFGEFRWTRSFILRDDFTSEVPPDPNAVFYESPGITFVTLQEPPIYSTNIFRAFTPELWIAISGCSLIVFTFSRLLRSETWRKDSLLSDRFQTLMNFDLKSDTTGASRVWSFFSRSYRIVLTSSYGGMILVGILNPDYPWSPKTFKELNHTSNFIAAISYNSAVTQRLLRGTFMLNGISNSRWYDRDNLEKEEAQPYVYFNDDEKDPMIRYALLMNDYKKYHYLYGREQLFKTNSRFVHRFETDKESVLTEMNYISVAPGATKLHFLIHAIRKCFETGSWLRWKYLENNFFKLVAPTIVAKFGVYPPQAVRSLNYLDISTIFYVWWVGIVISGILFLLERFRQNILNRNHNKIKINRSSRRMIFRLVRSKPFYNLHRPPTNPTPEMKPPRPNINMKINNHF